jgi:hypothetical protein
LDLPLKRTLAQPPLPSVVAPVASVIRLAKLRPLTGRFSSSAGDTFTPILADVVSRGDASPATVIDSVTPASVRAASTGRASPTPSAISRLTGAKPLSSMET